MKYLTAFKLPNVSSIPAVKGAGYLWSLNGSAYIDNGVALNKLLTTSDLRTINGVPLYGTSGENIVTSTTGQFIANFSTGLDRYAVIISGAANIQANSNIVCWIQGDSTADNDVEAHIFANNFIKIVASDIVPGTGFRVDVLSDGTVTGTFNIRWSF